MKKVLLVLLVLASIAQAETVIQCDADGRNCVAIDF